MSRECEYSLDVKALEKDVEVFTFRAHGPGGQHRNKVESAVRLVHIPSGVSVVAAEHRSQARNRDLAFRRLRERLIERNRKEKPRIPTKPSGAQRAKRLQLKRHKAQKKAMRRRIQAGADS